MVSSKQGYNPTVTDMKADPSEVNKVQSNLPLPEQPPVPSDFNSSDARTVNVGSGGQSADISASGQGSSTLREPATTDSVGAAGREGKDGLDGIPKDAVSREAKNHPGLA